MADIDGHRYEVYPELSKVPNRCRLTLWEMYETALDMKEAVQEQRVYTLQQFFEAMIDPEHVKILPLMDGRPIGLMLGTHSLEKMRVNYVNPDFLCGQFPEAAAAGRLFYLTVAYFSPEIRGMGFFKWFVPLVLLTLADLCDVYVSDVSDAREALKDYVFSCAAEMGAPFRPEVVGTQDYYALIREF